ncbi:uncharacterized protein LOC131143502 isoform X1 [Malania oleifera]|uniref:uncharacterized protein LOC131143502 isoform X1 n=1 Tax=Malania oleifera TaxID=397392 RepID=UPI0025ADE8DC|nr:uncharacterized protein LOC131143502 isoform X1 [Malania oleifera]
MYHMQHKGEGGTSCSVLVARSLVILLTTVLRNFVTTVRKKAISSKATMQSQNRQSQAFQAAVQSSSTSSSAPPTVSSDSSFLTPAMVQQMIVSALGLQGTTTNSTSWIVDLGASNHMTSNMMGLHGVRKYRGMQNIQIDGGSTPVLFQLQLLDQMPGTVMAKGPKVGHLFPLQFHLLMLFLLLVRLLPIIMKFGIRNWVILILLSWLIL